MGKLEKTKIELDESDTKLFPKRKKAKGNFESTITQKDLTNASISSKMDAGVKKTKTTKRVLGREDDVKNIKQGASQAPKVIAVTGLIAVFMAWIVDRYPSDLVPTIMAGMLSLVAAYVLLKNN